MENTAWNCYRPPLPGHGENMLEKGNRSGKEKEKEREGHKFIKTPSFFELLDSAMPEA